MQVNGRCHCGQITFQAEVDPETVSICHCADCQRLGGTAFRVNVRAAAAGFSLRGEPKTFVKVAESGNRVRHAFCSDCGTPIYSSAVDNPTVYNLRIGAIEQRAALVPKRQGWRRSAFTWVDDLKGLPASEKAWSR